MCAREIPLPLTDGSNTAVSCWTRWRIGNTAAIRPGTDVLAMRPKVPEMNSNGKSTKLTIAGAASSFGMKVATAAPHAVKQNAPERDGQDQGGR